MPRLQVQSRRLLGRVVVLALVGILPPVVRTRALRLQFIRRRSSGSAWCRDRGPAPGLAASRRSRCRRPLSLAPFQLRPITAIAREAPGPIDQAANIPTSPVRSPHQSVSCITPLTWDGGSPVAGYGETVDNIALEHHVPVAVHEPMVSVRLVRQAGQRLVIPRYISGGANSGRVCRRRLSGRSRGNVHVVQRGDTLMSIARRNGAR